MPSRSNPVFPSPPTSWSPPLPPPPPSSAPAASSEKKETLLFEHLCLLGTRDSFLTDDDETCLALSRFATFDVPAGLVLRLRLLASTIVGDGEDLTLCFMKGVKAAGVVCSLKEENVNVVHSCMIPVISTCVGVQNGYPGEIHELLCYAERYAKQLLKPETAALTGVCVYFSPAMNPMIVATGTGTQAPGNLPQPAASPACQKVRALNQELKRRRGSDEGDRANRRRRRQEDEEEDEEEVVDEVFPHDSEKGMAVYWRDLVGEGTLHLLGHIEGVPTMPTFGQLDQAVDGILTQSNRPTHRVKEYYSFLSSQRLDVLEPGNIPWEQFRSEVIGVHVHALEGDEHPEEAAANDNELEHALEGDELPGEADAADDELDGVIIEEMGDNVLPK